VYTESNTGIIFGFRSIARLPTSDLAQAFDRVLRWDNGLTATKPFPGVGPGTLILSLAGTFRKDFAPRVVTVDGGEFPSLAQICTSANQSDSGACLTDQTPLDWSWITSLGTRYLLNNGLGFNFSFSAFYNKSRQSFVDGIDNDDLTDIDGVPVPTTGGDLSSSPFVSDSEVDRTLILLSTLSVSYVFNQNWSVSGGIQTFVNALIQRGDNSRSLANFLFFDDAERNNTRFFVSGTFTY